MLVFRVGRMLSSFSICFFKVGLLEAPCAFDCSRAMLRALCMYIINLLGGPFGRCLKSWNTDSVAIVFPCCDSLNNHVVCDIDCEVTLFTHSDFMRAITR
jgi:hypothetical protein